MSEGRRLFINSTWIIGGKITQTLISFIMGVLVVRYLGPRDYGTLNLAMAYSTFILPICTLGINNVIVNELINYPKREGVLLGSGIGMRCLTSSISILLLAIFILLTNPENINLQLISFVYSFVLLFRSFDLFDYFYQSKLLSKISSVISVIGYIIASIYRVFLLLNKSDVVWFAIAYVLDMFIVSLLFLIMYKKNGGELFFNMQIAKSLLSKSYH